MPTVGLVGGLGPESTVDYYRRILDEWSREEPHTAPSIVIDSLDVWRALRLVDTDRAALTDYLLSSVSRLAAAGADFIAMTANTPHMVFDAIAARAPVPLLSIVEVCAAEAKRLGLRRAALLGTRFTMEAPFFAEVFARSGIEIVPPGDAERAWIHERYVGELLKGEFRDDTRRQLVSIVARMRADDGIDGVILGGTELPLLIQSAFLAELPALDTTALHVAAIVQRLREVAAPRTEKEIQPQGQSDRRRPMKRRIDAREARRVGAALGIDFRNVDPEEFRRGLEVELEHGARDPETNVTDDDLTLTGRIAWAHLKEFPDYYTRLDKLEADADAYWKSRK